MKKRLTMFLACLLLSVGAALAQTVATGTVTSAEDGSPVIGASVKVVGTQTGAVTNIDGQFTVEVPNSNAQLEISYIGLRTQTVKAGRNMHVVLDVDAETQLDDVIVIGYGTTKRSTFTGSATEVKASEISGHVASTATNALVGKVAGLQATSSSGAPGSAPTIRLRGFGSYSASSTPLYVIDGVPMDQSIASVNPNDIESISVLKDAAATAIYGASGANGVILITTKKGREGKDAEVKFDAKWGSNSRLVPRYKLITDPAEYYETHYRAMYNSVAYNGGTSEEAYAFADANLFDRNNGGLGYQVFTVPEGEKFIGTNFKLNPNATLGYSDGTYTYLPDNWYDEAIHSAFRQEYNASVSGSTGRLNYYAGVGYLNDGGQVNNSKYQRYTGRTNVEYQAKKWLKLITNMSYSHSDSQTPSYNSTTYGSSTNMFYAANLMGAIYPLYVRDANGNIMKENGRTIYDANQTGFQRPGIIGNAVRDNEYNRFKSYGDVFTGQWGAIITPIEGLRLTANLAASVINTRNNYLYSRFGSATGTDGQASVSHNRYFTVNQQYIAEYSRTFADLHNFSILLGYEQKKYTDQDLSGSLTHLYHPNIGEIGNAWGPKDESSVNSATDHLMTAGYFGRLSYDYAERYFANIDIRRDGVSKFAPHHRWGTFWGLGLGWQINKEEFMKDVEWVDLLKLKVSYGENGNHLGMGWHAYADRYTPSYNSDSKQYTLSMTSKGNENLSWETKKQWNFGLDFSLFKYRLNGTFEVYTGTTSDLLWSKTVSLSSGLPVSSYPANVGNLRNSGVELSLDGSVIRNKNLDWKLNLALAHNKNKFTKLDAAIADNGLRYSNQIIRVGGSAQQGYMIRYEGTDKTNGRAMYRVAYDKDGNVLANSYGKDVVIDHEGITYDITQATRYDVGDLLPDVIGGFGTTLEAFGFDFTAQFAFQLGGKFYDGSYQQLMHNGQSAGNAMHRDLLDAWSPENPNSNIPRLSTAAVDDPGVGSQTPYDRFLTSSNYLSLTNLQLGYTLPVKWIRPLTLRSARVYFAGENLFLITKRKGMDPRYNNGIGSMTSGGGLASGSYAAMRSITAGVTVTF